MSSIWNGFITLDTSPAFVVTSAMDKLKVFFSILLLISIPISDLAVTTAEKSRAVNVDILIVGGTIVKMNAEREVIENGAIAITNGKIDLIGTRRIVERNSRPKRIINATGKVIIPGLINTHTHAAMSLFRGISDDLDLNDWLTKFIFPAEAKNVNEPFVRAGTRLALAEMIRGGTTTYCDMYYFEDAVAEETKKAGMRGVLGETIINFPVPDNETPEKALAYTERFIKKWQGDPLIVAASAPHAPYTVSTEKLGFVRAQSDRLNSPVIIHVAETKKERDDILAKYGKTPAAYLDSIGFLSDRTIAAHSVWLTPDEIDIYKRRGVGSAHCPQSNMKLRVRCSIDSGDAGQ